jgi:GH15 family glucan-1,4-alpha-glucosidase
MSANDDYRPIGDYALLADCHSAALVSRDGSVDWACLRQFDAGSVFARLLDHDRGGHFAVRAVDAVDTTRRYLDGTLVLETSVRSATGAARVIEAFAMRPGGMRTPRHQLLRVVEGVGGEVTFEIDCCPRFDYGGLRPWLRHHGEGVFSAVGGGDALVLTTDARLTVDRRASTIRARLTVGAGQRVRLSLVSQWAHQLDPAAGAVDDIDDRLDETIAWWRRWSSDTSTPAQHGAAVARSAAVLKGLTCAPTGAIVAAPTTSLPEQIGGERNWDYRYSWVRDSTLALEALAQAGHCEVARGFRDFLMRSSAGHVDDLQIMYGAYGQRRLPEQVLDLEGYRESRPVRIGNGAAEQRQLDVYGHILDAAHLWHTRHDQVDADEWLFLAQVVDAAADHWRYPDQGIWEMRGDPRHFVQSKVMCWVALDRGIRLSDAGAGDGDVDRWRTERDAVRDAVLTDGISRTGGHFVQAFGGDDIDASLLKLSATGFVDPHDDTMTATVAAIRERLSVPPDGFLRRYTTNGGDGLSGDEGTFLLCSLWLVDALSLQGEADAAEALFERVLAVGNDLGLLAEEYDPTSRELLGNFPQAFTHMGIIQSAFRLDNARRTSGVGA